MAVLFINYQDASIFLSSPLLLSRHLEAAIPRFHITRMGAVRDSSLDWLLEDLLNSTECRSGSTMIIKAIR